MVSEPIFYEQLNASSLTVVSPSNGSFQSNAGVSLALSTAQTSSYTFTFPSNLPSSSDNQPLFVSSAGNLSFGFPATLKLNNVTLSGTLTAAAVNAPNLTLTNATSGTNVSLASNNLQSQNYTWTFPTALPSSASQPIYVDTTGQLTTGFPATVNLTNLTATGTVSAASVTASSSVSTPSLLLSNGSVAAQIRSSGSQTSSFALTLLSALPSSAQPLFVDSTGQITAAYPSQVTLSNLTVSGSLNTATAIATQSVTTPSVILTNSNKTSVQLGSSTSQASSYVFTFPTSLPSSGTVQPMFVDQNGNATLGFPTSISPTNVAATGTVSGTSGTFPTLILPISAGSSTTATLKANANTSTSYSITLPVALPTSNQPLFVDQNGNATLGFPSTITPTNVAAFGTVSGTSGTFSNLILPIASGSSTTTTLKANGNATTSYSLTLPSALPSSIQPFFVDQNGNMTVGYPTTVTPTNVAATGSISGTSGTFSTLVLPIAAGSSTTATLKANANATASYSITLPVALGTSNQPLFVDQNGNATLGFPSTISPTNVAASGTISGTSGTFSTLVLPITAGATTTTTLRANANATTSYSITLPVALGTSNQPLFVDQNGNATLGFPSTISPTNIAASGTISGTSGTFSTLVLPIASGSSTTTTLKANGNATSSYTLTLPSALPASIQPFFVDQNGNMTVGYPTTISPTNIAATGSISGTSGTFSTLVLPIASGSSTTTTLKANGNASSSYSLTLPSALPASIQPLFVDQNGSMTVGYPTTVTPTNIAASGTISGTSGTFSTLVLPIASGSSTSTTLKANANATTSYTMILPSALPSSSAPLYVDNNGNITTGFPATVNMTKLVASTSVTTPSLNIPINSSSTTAVSFQSSTNLASSYSLVLPTALPSSAGQALLSDTSGNLSWGSVASSGSSNTSTATTFTSFAATAPQSTAANVTGLQVTQVGVVQLFITIAATTNLASVVFLTVYQLRGVWQLSYSYETSDDSETGIDFQINGSTGQITYTSPSFAGWTATTFTWPTLTNATSSGSLSVNYPALKVNAGNSSNSNITVGSNGVVILPSVTYDTVGMYSTSSGAATIKVAGIYLIQAQLYLTSATTGTLNVAVNGSIDSRLWQENNTGDVQWHGGQLISVKQGDVVTLLAAGAVIYGGDNYTSTWSLSMVAPVASSGTLLAQAAASGAPAAAQGSFLSVGGPTFTDTATAASGTATAFSGTYLAAPTLAAANTGVVTTTASTFTVVGPPVAGTNETITNPYSINVQSGVSNFNGSVQQNALFYYKAYGGNNSVSASANTNYAPTLTTVYNNLGSALTVSNGQYVLTCPSTGTWNFTINGYTSAGVLTYNIYIGTFANGQNASNGANNICFDNCGVASTNKTISGSSRLMKGDVVNITMSSSAACTLYVYSLGIYQINNSM